MMDVPISFPFSHIKTVFLRSSVVDTSPHDFYKYKAVLEHIAPLATSTERLVLSPPNAIDPEMIHMAYEKCPRSAGFAARLIEINGGHQIEIHGQGGTLQIELQKNATATEVGGRDEEPMRAEATRRLEEAYEGWLSTCTMYIFPPRSILGT